jgi:hypothetical protein
VTVTHNVRGGGFARDSLLITRWRILMLATSIIPPGSRLH